MDGQAGWAIEASGLREVLTDRRRAEQSLAAAGPVDRLFLLGLLGRAEQGVAEGVRLLDGQSDPWQLLVRLADLHGLRSDFEAAEECSRQAWRHALGRERQAATLHSIGIRQFEQGDRDAAAASFCLALTLLSLFPDTPLRARVTAALTLVRAGDAFDAVILAGGRGVRMAGGPAGTPKPLRKVAGWPMLDHVLLAASAASRQIVVGGGSRIGIGQPLFCREEPPGSGPVAGVSAGLRHVQQPVVLVLAADLPFVAGALGPLRARLAAEPGTDAVALVDPAGRVNYLAAAWRTGALYAALDRLGDPAGRPVRALYETVVVSLLPDFEAWGADCDTPEDLRLAEDRIRRRRPGRLPEAQLAWPRLELHSPS